MFFNWMIFKTTVFDLRKLLFFAIVIPVLFSFFSCGRRSAPVAELPLETNSVYRFGICVDSLKMEESVIKPGENLSVIFSRLGYSAAYIDKISNATVHVLDHKKIAAGNNYYTLSTRDSLSGVKYVVFANSATDFSVIDLSREDSVKAYLYEKPLQRKKAYMEGVIRSSLWNSIIENGEDPMMALKLSDIYAWQIDFFGIQPGDAFKVMYEVSYVDDTIPLRIEGIEGAVFSHNGVDYYAIPFEQDGSREFFDLDGNSLRRAFLKAPMDYFRITSRFSNSRLHPVLKRYRAHHGVDYAAPAGTPVKTIGDGIVVAKGYQKGGGGNYVKVKHNATYTTTYMHLKGFAKNIETGSRVQQGQVIGYVGSTGLSTGPHLDFRVYKNGQPIDPLKMESPPSLPVKEELIPLFDSVKRKVLQELEIHASREIAEK